MSDQAPENVSLKQGDLVTSKDTRRLMEAISQFQGICPVVNSNKVAKIFTPGKANYTYNYADLAQILAVTQQARANCGLAVVFSSNKATNIICRVSHAHSGQWMEGSLIVESNIRDAKSIGSALSYGQRYLIRGMLGIPVVDDLDDDGTDASKAGSDKRKPSYNQQPEVEQPKTMVQFEITNELELAMVNSSTIDELLAIFNDLPISGKEDAKVKQMFKKQKERIYAASKASGGAE